MKAAAVSVVKVEDVIEVTPAASDALKPEAGSAPQALKVVLREYCFVKDTSFNELEDLHKLQTGSAVHQSI